MVAAQGASLVFLRRMLWRHFIAEERWVLEWIRIPSDACMWTWKFLNPERKRCGFKNIRICVDGALVSIEKTVFDHIFKHFEARQKFSASRRIFNSLLDVWKCGHSRFFLFDIFIQTVWHLPLVNFVKACIDLYFSFYAPPCPGICTLIWDNSNCKWLSRTIKWECWLWRYCNIKYIYWENPLLFIPYSVLNYLVILVDRISERHHLLRKWLQQRRVAVVKLTIREFILQSWTK